MKIKDIARICHESNVALCDSFAEETSGDWDSCPQWQRDSSISGVKYRLGNPGAPVEDQHEQWCQEKLDAGWSYGPVKDSEAKTHPCLVGFLLLPPEQQAKDAVFCAVVEACRDLVSA